MCCIRACLFVFRRLDRVTLQSCMEQRACIARTTQSSVPALRRLLHAFLRERWHMSTNSASCRPLDCTVNESTDHRDKPPTTAIGGQIFSRRVCREMPTHVLLRPRSAGVFSKSPTHGEAKYGQLAGARASPSDEKGNCGMCGRARRRNAAAPALVKGMVVAIARGR